jgi:hypothetical protein
MQPENLGPENDKDAAKDHKEDECKVYIHNGIAKHPKDKYAFHIIRISGCMMFFNISSNRII